ncbi:MAG: SirB2 family protein [Spongiibacteraceae bacterium]
MYLTLKMLHMTCALISIAGFIFRGTLRLQGSALLQNKFLKIAPHIVDTVLLLSAIGLTVTLQQYPFADSWLTAKLLGLLVYIFLGVYTLKIAKTQPARLIAFVLAILVFAYIAIVARTHSPFPFI